MESGSASGYYPHSWDVKEEAVEIQSSISSMVKRDSFSHPTCGVCSKPYNDPRLLPCLHSFCLECLHRKQEKNGSQQVFKCPTCNQAASIPVGGASILPRNLHLGFEVEVAGYMSKMVSDSEVCCDHCIDGSSGPAVVFCCSCRQFLCKFCHEHHKRGRQLSKHTIVGLDQEGANQLQATMKPSEQHCCLLNHEDNKLTFYCNTCTSINCSCTIVAHKGHDVIELSTVAKAHQMKITGALEDAGKVVTQLTECIMGNSKVIEQVEISKRNALLAINQAFEILSNRLEERKNALLLELETISLSKKAALTLQKEEFEKMVKDIGRYTDVASQILQTHTDHEIVALGGLIPTELHAAIKKVRTTTLTPNQHSNFTASLQTDNLVRELSKFGDIVDLSPSSSTWASKSVAKARTAYQLKVESNTSQRKRYPFGAVKVKAEMRPKGDCNGNVVYGEVKDHGDGTYAITLTPQTAGPHQLLITMDDQHVQNSPREIDVMRDIITLCAEDVSSSSKFQTNSMFLEDSTAFHVATDQTITAQELLSKEKTYNTNQGCYDDDTKPPGRLASTCEIPAFQSKKKKTAASRVKSTNPTSGIDEERDQLAVFRP